ncbi:hypothetical protein BBD41_03140 [Paenibacillus ihbetae]|uniref:Phage protein n=1 Tax=Paenibacillus ihbetae TaxID=1870820 RepID=A0A1B2E8Y9_9BACL|nr:hypothetical protein BBD41_03140 [Paenibacillus ihbetae]
MKIEIRKGDEVKTYVQDFISGRMFRRTIEIQKLFQVNEQGKNVIDETHIDALVAYVVELFGKQFTVDEFYDGVEARSLISTIMSCVQEVAGQVTQAAGVTDPN